MIKKLRRTKRIMEIYRKVGLSDLIISDGMPRSGSTLMFNIVRIVLQKNPSINMASGWIGDLGSIDKAGLYLIKVHGIDDAIRKRATHIFYSYRDVRTALVSNYRKFGIRPSMEIATQWIRYWSAQKQLPVEMVRYEDLVCNTRHVIERIGIKLSQSIEPDTVLKEIPAANSNEEISSGYSKTTLLHRNHGTDTKEEDWKYVLSPELKNKLNEEFRWWFQENGYPEE